MNISAVSEHVGEIKRSIGMTKERTRYTTSKFFFQSIPTNVLIYTVYIIFM